MTGNDTLLITLLVVLTACVGYAAGRLHQWYRTVLERDEAYRDGYDTATRSVFSLAARLIGPKRAVRGTVVVGGSASSPGPSSVTPPPVGLRAATLGAPSAPGVCPAETSGQSGDRSSSSSGARRAASRAGAPARAGSTSSRADLASSRGGSSVSPGSPSARAADSSVSSTPSSSSPSSSRVSSSSEDGEEPVGAAGGRHLVPDELVQGPTYRLPPDRVARAKVRGSSPRNDESQETNRLPSVPRPRSS